MSTLSLALNRIEMSEPLTNMTVIKQLNISMNRIRSFGGLKEMSKLKLLDMSNNLEIKNEDETKLDRFDKLQHGLIYTNTIVLFDKLVNTNFKMKKA